MKAVRCCDKQVRVVDVPAPSGAGITVNVRSAGICSSDLHMIEAGFELPATIGHEVAGTLSDGRAVALEPIAPCGHCDMCVQGDYYLCRLGAGMVHGVALDGGRSDQQVVLLYAPTDQANRQEAYHVRTSQIDIRLHPRRVDDGRYRHSFR